MTKKLIIGMSLFLTVILAGCNGNNDNNVRTSDNNNVAQKDNTQNNNVENNTQDNNEPNNVQDNQVPDGFALWEDTYNNFSMPYPSDWQPQKDQAGTAIYFFSPLGQDDAAQENFAVIVANMSGYDISLDQYSTMSIEGIQDNIANVNMIENQKEQFMGQTGQKVIYEGDLEGERFKWLQIWTIKNDNVYMFTYTALASTFDEYLSQAKTAYQNFDVLN